MTDYTLNVDTSNIAVSFTPINLVATRVLYVEGTPDVAVIFTPLRDRIHEWFYAMEGELESEGIKTTYRMGATISNERLNLYKRPRYFKAIQTLIFPEDVNVDKRFGV